jgi:hypothetical protein
MDLKEQNDLVRGNRAKKFVRKSAYLFGVIRLDRRAEPHREQPPFFNLQRTAAVVLFLAVCSFGSRGITWRQSTCGMRQINHMNGHV